MDAFLRGRHRGRLQRDSSWRRRGCAEFCSRTVRLWERAASLGQARSNSIATVRGRIGYVWSPNVLLYVTGGGAWGRTSYSSVDVFFAGCPNCAATSFSNTSSGYVVGGGVEWAPWSNNWVVRAEYLYYKLSGVTGTSLVVGTPIVGANPVWNNMSISSGRVGVSYRFY